MHRVRLEARINRMFADPEYHTLDEAVTGLTACEKTFLQTADRRAIFVSVYAAMSRDMSRRLRAQEFNNNEWMESTAIAFINLYRVALVNYESGSGPVPKCWSLAFDAAVHGPALVMQSLLLGMSAHINRDLPFALNAVGIDPNRDSKYQDHDSVNKILESLTQSVEDAVSSKYAPGLQGVEQLMAGWDKPISSFGMRAARQGAWDSAVAMTAAKGHGLQLDLVHAEVEERAVLIARSLLVPDKDPYVVAKLQEIDRGIDWRECLRQAVFPDRAAI